MKAHYRTRDNRVTFEFEGQAKDVFEGIAEVQEQFEVDGSCGCCKGMHLRFRVRKVDDNKYYEMLCEDCTATLGFGQHKVGGGLYPRRRDKDNRELPNRGWKVWQGKKPPADGAPVRDEDVPF
jgi:hypothetical protein